MQHVVLSVFFFCLSCGLLPAQYQFTTFDEAAGLPDKSCRGMAVDSSGTLWVGTQEGVAKWDGTNFVPVPINDSVVNPFVSVIEVAPDGNLWVGYLTFSEELGISVIDPDGNLLLRADAELTGAPGTWIFDIAFGPDSLVYVAHPEGISTYDGSEWVLHPPAPDNFAASPVFDLHFAPDSSLWVGTTFGLAHRRTSGSWENFYTLSTDLINNNIRTLEFDTAGNLWIGTSGGLSVYDGQNFINYGLEAGLENDFIRDIAFDSLGQAWLMTDDGFSVFDGSVFQHFKTYEHQFIDNPIKNVLLHPELGTWLTTREGMVKVTDMVSSNDREIFPAPSKMEVFPNPTTGQIDLRTEEMTFSAVSVFSLQGRLLRRFESEEYRQKTTLDLSFLTPAAYWLRITTGNGTVVHKVIVQ